MFDLAVLLVPACDLAAFHVQGWIFFSGGQVGDVWCRVTGSFVGGRVWVRIAMGQIGIGLAWRKCNTCGGMYREENNNGTHAQPGYNPELELEDRKCL